MFICFLPRAENVGLRHNVCMYATHVHDITLKMAMPTVVFLLPSKDMF